MKKTLLSIAVLCLLAFGASIADAVSIHTMQVTIGASTTQITTGTAQAREVIFQNNAAHSMRVGDVATSSTRGALLNAASGGNAGGSMTVGTLSGNVFELNSFWVNGTQNDVLDVIYIN